MWGLFCRLLGLRPVDRFGALPRALLSELPPLPEVDTALIDPYVCWLRTLTPAPLRSELRALATQLGSWSKAYFWNLHYEIFGGACVSAVLPGKSGYVYHRRMEWDVGFTPRFDFREIAPGCVIRYTPGYVGALSGYTANWHIAMNAEPGGEDIDIVDAYGLPASWILRRAIARNRGFTETVDWLLKQRAVRGAFVLIASRTQAYWIDLQKGWNTEVFEQASFPDALVVGNSYEPAEMDDQGWVGKTDAPYQAESADAWVLDQYVRSV